jgi:hypothetical protein
MMADPPGIERGVRIRTASTLLAKLAEMGRLPEGSEVIKDHDHEDDDSACYDVYGPLVEVLRTAVEKETGEGLHDVAREI